MVAAFLDPIVVDDDTLAVDAIREVGPGRPLLRRRAHPGALPHRVPPADDLRLAQLRDVGRGRPARGRRPGRRSSPARFLAAYEPPPMDPAVREELDDFVARRVAEGGVPTDF